MRCIHMIAKAKRHIARPYSMFFSISVMIVLCTHSIVLAKIAEKEENKSTATTARKNSKHACRALFGCDSQPSSMFSQQDTCSMAVRYSSNKSEPCIHVSCCTLLLFFFLRQHAFIGCQHCSPQKFVLFVAIPDIETRCKKC